MKLLGIWLLINILYIPGVLVPYFMNEPWSEILGRTELLGTILNITLGSILGYFLAFRTAWVLGHLRE